MFCCSGRKQCTFDSPQSQAAEFELGIKPPQATVGGGEVKVCLRGKFAMIQCFRTARAAGPNEGLNLHVKHGSLGRFNPGFL